MIVSLGDGIIQYMQRLEGKREGDVAFDDVVRGYWSRGYGTTCAVVLNWAAERAGCPARYLNRGAHYKIQKHLSGLWRLCKEFDALEEGVSIPPSRLSRGDAFLIVQDGKPENWHVGVSLTSQPQNYMSSIDGGQSFYDQTRGMVQGVAVVKRDIDGTGKLGPNPFRPIKAIFKFSVLYVEKTLDR